MRKKILLDIEQQWGEMFNTTEQNGRWMRYLAEGKHSSVSGSQKEISSIKKFDFFKSNSFKENTEQLLKKAISREKKEAVKRILLLGCLSHEQIAKVLDVSLTTVSQVQKSI